MRDGIRVSPKHGVNPSVMHCFLCGEAYGVALLGLLPGDREAPMSGVYERKPCNGCLDKMKLGVVLVQVKDGTEGTPDPYRTGPMVVVKDDAIRRLITPPELVAQILAARFAMVPQATWTAIGLPNPTNKEWKAEE